MPPNGDTTRRAQYPDNGWSSWFGHYIGTDYPTGLPYGILFKAPGSTGIFEAMNKGVRLLIAETNSGGNMFYVSTFQPPVSIIDFQIVFRLDPVGLPFISLQYYFEGGAPPFFYFQETVQPWPNMREILTFPGPPPPPLPLLSIVGDPVIIQPWNKKGWGQLV